LIGVFHYAFDGSPQWHLVVGDISSGSMTAEMKGYFGGQTLTGTFVVAQPGARTGDFTAVFGHPCKGRMGVTNTGTVPVERFSFGGEANLCPSPAAPAPTMTGADKCPAGAFVESNKTTGPNAQRALTTDGYNIFGFNAPAILLEWRVCSFAIRTSTLSLVPAEVRDLAIDVQAERHYGIFADGAFASLANKRIGISKELPMSEGIGNFRVIAYTQDEQGKWKREALATTGTDSTTAWKPGIKLVSFFADVTKPGFYTVGYP
jgi:hypothetical protein